MAQTQADLGAPPPLHSVLLGRLHLRPAVIPLETPQLRATVPTTQESSVTYKL